jgi:hypothetical protein
MSIKMLQEAGFPSQVSVAASPQASDGKPAANTDAPDIICNTAGQSLDTARVLPPIV